MVTDLGALLVYLVKNPDDMDLHWYLVALLSSLLVSVATRTDRIGWLVLL